MSVRKDILSFSLMLVLTLNAIIVQSLYGTKIAPFYPNAVTYNSTLYYLNITIKKKFINN